MTETPQELRERADALEAEAEYNEWRKSYWLGYQFEKDGRCFEHWLVDTRCPLHTPTYTDDYGTRHMCPCCGRTDGIIKRDKRVPAPQYDAPKPPKEYTPHGN